MANLTPEDIGALNKNGDTANGKIFFKKGTMVNYNNGVPAVSGFVILAQIKITDIYVNNPIVLVNNCVGFGLSPFYGIQKVIAYDYPMKCEAIIT